MVPSLYLIFCIVLHSLAFFSLPFFLHELPLLNQNYWSAGMHVGHTLMHSYNKSK